MGRNESMWREKGYWGRGSICEVLERKEIGKKVDYKYVTVKLWNLLEGHVRLLVFSSFAQRQLIVNWHDDVPFNMIQFHLKARLINDHNIVQVTTPFRVRRTFMLTIGLIGGSLPDVCISLLIDSM